MAAGFIAKQAMQGVVSKAVNSAKFEIDGARSQITNTLGMGRSQQHQLIDWTDFNYPPYIRVVHYDLAELPIHMQTIVRWIHISFIITLVMTFVNVIHTIVVVAGGGPGLAMLYTLLNMIIFPTLAGYTFYTGYKGLATVSPTTTNTYTGLQAFLLVVYLGMSLANLGCSNGWIRFADLNRYPMTDGMKGFWTYAIVVESLTWTANAAIAAWCIFRVRNFNPYANPDRPYVSSAASGAPISSV